MQKDRLLLLVYNPHGCVADPPTGVACQRQHWSSHKRECKVLAEAELRSTFGHHTVSDIKRLLSYPDPSELRLLPKLSAVTWTTRPEYSGVHTSSLISRADLLGMGRPAPGDTKEGLIRLLKRAVMELPWPELPGGTEEMFKTQLTALTRIAESGEPEAAVEILSRHVEDVETGVKARDHVAIYHIYRLDWLLAAARKFNGHEGKRGAYVAEAKGLMERATRSLEVCSRRTSMTV
jgi:hypothetical protein